MNRRQKIKKLKRELEWYKKYHPVGKMNVVYPSVPYEIRTLVAERVFQEQDMKFLNEEDIRYLLAKDLLEGVKDVMDVQCYRGISECSEARHYRAEIQVAIPKTST